MQPVLSPEDARLVSRLERIAKTMDSAFRLPGTRIRIGFDSIVGLIPGVGDSLTALPALYIIGSAWRLDAPPGLIGRMLFNSGVDLVVGSVPLIGDIFDVGWKSNRRNVDLLKDWISSKTRA